MVDGWLARWGVPAVSLAMVDLHSVKVAQFVAMKVEALPWGAEGVRIGRVGEYVKLGC